MADTARQAYLEIWGPDGRQTSAVTLGAVDENTPNGTFVDHGESGTERISDRRQLQDGDIIRILGGLGPDVPRY